MEYLSEKYHLKPFVKWVGGKRQLLPSLKTLLPKTYDVYVELFVGGGALLFDLCPKKAIVNDINSELINLYKVVRDDVENLIHYATQFTDDRECYNEVRSWDRNEEFYSNLSDVEKAARILYMNRVCFNGVYRVNSHGYFNVPYGPNKHVRTIDVENLRNVSAYLNDADITFVSKSFEDVKPLISEGSFVYLDPPYDPISKTSAFTTYAKDGFSKNDQIELRKLCDWFNENGIYFMESNSSTEFICEEYNAYQIHVVKAARFINRNGDGRGPVNEVVICNY